MPKPADEEIRKLAEDTVYKIRGCWDAPGFEACVEAEILNIKEGMK